jgi:hypothetical protein
MVARVDAAAPSPCHGHVAEPGDPRDRTAIPPIGQAGPGAEDDGLDMSTFTTVTLSYAEVLEIRTGRVGMVRDFLATVASDELAATRKNPWDPEYQETTLS